MNSKHMCTESTTLDVCMQKQVKQNKNHICASKLLGCVEIVFVEQRERQQISGFEWKEMSHAKWANYMQMKSIWDTFTFTFILYTIRALPCVMYIQWNRQFDAIPTETSTRIPKFNRNADEINRGAITKMFHSDRAYSTVFEIRIIYMNQIR